MKHWSERPLDKRKEDLSKQVYEALMQAEKHREKMNKEFNKTIKDNGDNS